MFKKNKKGAGVVGSLISGVGGLIIAVVIILLVVATLLGAGLLTSGTTEDYTAGNLSANFSTGINNVALQIPTILKIAAIVILIGVVVFLAVRARPAMNMGGGSL